MAQDTNTPPRPEPVRETGRVPRWFKIVLGLSLAVNLGVAGLLAGAAFRSEPKGPPPSISGYATAYIKALPHEDRRAILDKMRKSGGKIHLSGPERRALYSDMLAALRAPDLDRAVIAQVLSKQNAASLGVQAGVQDQWMNVVSGMSAEERSAYADQIEEVLKRRRGPRKDRKP